jgi:hypothetical protein
MATFADQIRSSGQPAAVLLPGHQNRVAHQFRQETSVPLGPQFLTS